MLRTRTRLASRALWIVPAVAQLLGCGAKTALDVPPPAPCEIDPSVERVPFLCSTFELGPPIALTDEPGPAAFDAPILGVDAIDAVTSPEGAFVVYQYLDERTDTVETRTLSLDPTGRPLGESRTFVARRHQFARSIVEPSAVVWGCGRAALGGLMSQRSDGSSRETGCALVIDTEATSRTITAGAEELCSDLQQDGEGLSWLQLQLTSPAGIRLERADRNGGSRSTERTGFPLLYRRVQLADGTFVAVQRASTFDAPGAELTHYSREGESVGTARITDRFLRRFASAVDEAGARWIVWSESDSRDDDSEEDLFAARTGEDGSLAPRVPLDASGMRALYTETRPVWLGRRLVLPLRDDENAVSLAVLDEEGARVALLPVSEDAPQADLVLVSGGALLLYGDSRFAIEDRGLRVHRGSVLTARTVRCTP